MVIESINAVVWVYGVIPPEQKKKEFFFLYILSLLTFVIIINNIFFRGEIINLNSSKKIQNQQNNL